VTLLETRKRRKGKGKGDCRRERGCRIRLRRTVPSTGGSKEEGSASLKPLSSFALTGTGDTGRVEAALERESER